MRVYGWWHGGDSYAVSGPDDTEEFSSLKDAAAQTWHRERGGDPYYPAVSNSEMWIFHSDPRQSDGDAYPDRIIRVGPRGGTRVERT